MRHSLRPPARHARDDEERVLPLINVVFLLLIFFMVAGRLSATDPFRIEPPRSTSEADPEPRELLVLVGTDGRLAVGGKTVDVAGLRTLVADRLAGDGARVRLKADGRVAATRVVAIMETLREAGVERLSLLTVPEGG